jgi:hypothetical protein
MRRKISAIIKPPIIIPVVVSEPSVVPVAMSIACLQAITHDNWHATSITPIAMLAKACPLAFLEFCHSHFSNFFVGIPFAFTVLLKYFAHIQNLFYRHLSLTV